MERAFNFGKVCWFNGLVCGVMLLVCVQEAPHFVPFDTKSGTEPSVGLLPLQSTPKYRIYHPKLK